MKIGKAFLAATAALLVACGNSSTPDLTDTKRRGAAGNLPTCDEAFAATFAGASAATARVGPRINWGSPETYILSFTTPAAREAAARRLRSAAPPEVDVATMHVFRNLAMIALPTTQAAPAHVVLLRRVLDGLPLISIWGNEPLRYHTGTSRGTIGADVVESDLGLDGAGIGVAVIDSGIDTTQGDFANVAYNAKWVPGLGFVESMFGDTTSGHGTHVAGTIGGSGASSGGLFRGIAPGAHLVGLGMGDAIIVFDATLAFDLVLDPAFRARYNIRVTNNSYGPLEDPLTGEAPPFDPAGPIELASKAAYDAGIINVFSAGNAGPGPKTLSPYAASPCNIGVANANREGGLDLTSSRGDPNDPFYVVDIAAPGAFITAARARSGAVTAPRPDFPDYSTISGTSMAAPHVAGAVALLLQASPSLTFEDVQRLLQETAVPMRADAPIADVQIPGRWYEPWEAGPGMVNVAAAAAGALRRRAPALTAGSFERHVRATPVLLGSWAGLAGFIVGAAAPAPTPRVNPCLCGVFDRHYVADVPATVAGPYHLRVRLAYANQDEIWRIRVFGPASPERPDGDLLVDVNSQGSGGAELVATVANPAPGTYRAMVSEYLTQGSAFTVTMSLDPP